jgi:hypothetical protein
MCGSCAGLDKSLEERHTHRTLSVAAPPFLHALPCFPCRTTAIDLLPDEVAGDYKTARDKGVADREHNPVRFLVRDNFDPWAAAQRICKHWAFRREAFGDDRWLLPMNLSGTGAMRAPEIRLLGRGGICLVTEKSGQQTLIYDLKRTSQEDTDCLTRARSLMYLSAKWATDQSTRDGVNALILASSSNVRPDPRSTEILQKAFSVNLSPVGKTTVVLDSGDMRRMLVKYCGTFIASRFHRGMGRKPHMVAESTRESTMSKLVELGYNKSVVPEEHGGTLSISQFCDSIAVQVENDCREAGHTAIPLQHTLVTVPPKTANDQTRQKPQKAHKQQETLAPSATSSGEEQVDTTASQTGDTAVTMLAGGSSLLLQTCMELNQSGPPQRDEQYYRERNALYARRNYQRKKERVEALEQTYMDLRTQNEWLKNENSRLEALLWQARLWLPT